MSSNVRLSFHDRLTHRRVSIVIVADSKMLPPGALYAPIMHPLELIKCRKSWKFFFAHHRRQQALPSLGCVVGECSPCGRVRIILPYVAFACQRLAAAPADMHMAFMSWS